MTEITFEQIHDFIKQTDLMVKNEPKNMRTVVLLSLDADRILRKMTSGQFQKSEDGSADTFRGLPIVHVMADGWISVVWEDDNE